MKKKLTENPFKSFVIRFNIERFSMQKKIFFSVSEKIISFFVMF